MERKTIQQNLFGDYSEIFTDLIIKTIYSEAQKFCVKHKRFETEKINIIQRLIRAIIGCVDRGVFDDIPKKKIEGQRLAPHERYCLGIIHRKMGFMYADLKKEFNKVDRVAQRMSERFNFSSVDPYRSPDEEAERNDKIATIQAIVDGMPDYLREGWKCLRGGYTFKALGQKFGYTGAGAKKHFFGKFREIFANSCLFHDGK